MCDRKDFVGGWGAELGSQRRGKGDAGSLMESLDLLHGAASSLAGNSR